MHSFRSAVSQTFKFQEPLFQLHMSADHWIIKMGEPRRAGIISFSTDNCEQIYITVMSLLHIVVLQVVALLVSFEVQLTSPVLGRRWAEFREVKKQISVRASRSEREVLC